MLYNYYGEIFVGKIFVWIIYVHQGPYYGDVLLIVHTFRKIPSVIPYMEGDASPRTITGVAPA